VTDDSGAAGTWRFKTASHVLLGQQRARPMGFAPSVSEDWLRRRATSTRPEKIPPAAAAANLVLILPAHRRCRGRLRENSEPEEPAAVSTAPGVGRRAQGGMAVSKRRGVGVPFTARIEVTKPPAVNIFVWWLATPPFTPSLKGILRPQCRQHTPRGDRRQRGSGHVAFQNNEPRSAGPAAGSSNGICSVRVGRLAAAESHPHAPRENSASGSGSEPGPYPACPPEVQERLQESSEPEEPAAVSTAPGVGRRAQGGMAVSKRRGVGVPFTARIEVTKPPAVNIFVWWLDNTPFFSLSHTEIHRWKTFFERQIASMSLVLKLLR